MQPNQPAPAPRQPGGPSPNAPKRPPTQARAPQNPPAPQTRPSINMHPNDLPPGMGGGEAPEGGYRPQAYAPQPGAPAANTGTAMVRDQTYRDPAFRNAPPASAIVGGGSRVHGFVAMIVGGLLVGGFAGVPILIARDGQSAPIFIWPVILGGLIFAAGVGMLIRGGEK